MLFPFFWNLLSGIQLPQPNRASRLGLNREAWIQSLRTAIATVLSLLLARTLKLPEFYWAPISTIVILLSTIDPLTLAWQRFAGTAVPHCDRVFIPLVCLRRRDTGVRNYQRDAAPGDRISVRCDYNEHRAADRTRRAAVGCCPRSVRRSIAGNRGGAGPCPCLAAASSESNN